MKGGADTGDMSLTVNSFIQIHNKNPCVWTHVNLLKEYNPKGCTLKRLSSLILMCSRRIEDSNYRLSFCKISLGTDRLE